MTQYEYEQRIQREVWLVITLFAILVMCLGAGYLHAAEPYVTAGFGKAKLRMTGKNDLWQISGYDMVKHENSNAWKIGVGYKANPYLSAELDYRDLGQFNNYGIFVADDARVPGNYNSTIGRCNGACDPTVLGYQHGTTKGLGLSIVASPGWAVEPFIRAGLFYHVSSFTSTQYYTANPHASSFVNGYPETRYAGIAPFGGAGVRAAKFELEYTYYPGVGSTDSPYRNTSSVMASFRWEL